MVTAVSLCTTMDNDSLFTGSVIAVCNGSCSDEYTLTDTFYATF